MPKRSPKTIDELRDEALEAVKKYEKKRTKLKLPPDEIIKKPLMRWVRLMKEQEMDHLVAEAITHLKKFYLNYDKPGFPPNENSHDDLDVAVLAIIKLSKL